LSLDRLPEGKMMNSWEVKSGKPTNLIDLLPFVITQSWYKDLRTFSGLPTNLDVDMWDYKLELPVHRNIGENNDVFLCLRLAFGRKCPVCEDLSAEYDKKEPDDKIIKALNPSWRCYYNIYDYDEPEKDIQQWEDVSYHLFEKHMLEDAELSDEGYVAFSDIEDGKSIEFRGKEKALGKNTFIEAQAFNFLDRKPYDENIVNDTLSFDMLVIIPTYEDVAAAHHELEGYDTPDETRGAADAGSDTGSRERERPSRDRGDRPDRSRPSPDETDKKPWEDKKCPEGHEFGVACTKEAECQTCPEDAYAACLKEADELEKGPETPADEPAPERTRTRTTTASADRPARERTRSR